MGMMRRRPSGESPSSWTGPSVISARRRGWRFKRFQQAEKLAERTRRTAFLLLAARVADQGAQRPGVGAGMLGHVSGQRAVVGEELAAQRFDPPVARRFLRG